MSRNYEQRDLTGILFRNEEKEKETHCDYRGDAKIDGVDYWMSGYIKTAKNGKKYMGLTFKPKEAKPQTKPALKVVGGADADPNDEIPF